MNTPVPVSVREAIIILLITTTTTLIIIRRFWFYDVPFKTTKDTLNEGKHRKKNDT